MSVKPGSQMNASQIREDGECVANSVLEALGPPTLLTTNQTLYTEDSIFRAGVEGVLCGTIENATTK